MQARPRILVIDDEPGMLSVIVQLLKRNGFEVQATETGEQALELVRQNSFDLILSDVDLPNADGFAICRNLKQDPRWRAVPVILMSGRLPEERRDAALEVGAVDYLSKPFPAAELLEKIFNHIQPASGI